MDELQQFYQSIMIDLLISLLHLLYCILPLPDDFLPFLMNSAEVFSCLVKLYLFKRKDPNDYGF